MLTESQMIDEVEEAMRKFGLDPLRTGSREGNDGLIVDGKPHSFSTHPKRPNDTAGWYSIHRKADGLVATFGDLRNWGDRHEVFTIFNKDKAREKESPKARAARLRKIEQEHRKHEREETRRRKRAAAVAKKVMDVAQPAPRKHPYLVRKHINDVGLFALPSEELKKLLRYTPKCDDGPLDGDILLVPMYVGKTLSTIEMIDANGLKASLWNGARKGALWTPRDLPGATVIGLAEGMATAKTVGMATRELCISVGSCANFGPVLDALATAYPKAELIVYSDKGRGQEIARKAAEERGKRCVPPPEDIAGTDFNDLQSERGLGAVRRWIAKLRR